MEETHQEFTNMPTPLVSPTQVASNTLPPISLEAATQLISAETAHGLPQKLEIQDSKDVLPSPTSRSTMSALTTNSAVLTT